MVINAAQTEEAVENHAAEECEGGDGQREQIETQVKELYVSEGSAEAAGPVPAIEDTTMPEN